MPAAPLQRRLSPGRAARTAGLGLAAGALLAGVARAQDSTLSPARAPRPVAVAAPRSGPIALDGRLDDAAWAAATPITTFRQREPVEGAPPAQRTEVRFLYDDEALYVGARLFESRGAQAVTSRLVRRDDWPESDIFQLNLDTFRDRLHDVEFQVNPAGWRSDESDGDESWDPVWEARSQVDSLGWSTELRIPFSQLRFSRDSIQRWGLNVSRETHATQERDLWAYWGQQDAGGPSFYGDLTGIVVRRPPRRTELLPYLVARQQRLGSADRRSPFYEATATDLRVGGDVKYLLTNAFTLSGTVNPDFGQVEVDPAVVNLSAFETFYGEKRPFFVEGSGLFDFGNPGCNINCGFGLFPFYSRRVGRAPQGAGLARARGDYADIPDNTTILGAAKVTGRTRNGYSVGVLDALTRRAVARVAVDGGIARQPVEPLTNSFVARVTRDLRGGTLVLGAIATATNRSIRDSSLATLLPRASQALGADVTAYWKDHAYRLYAAVAASNVTGDSGAVARLQRSSARYFQRPDRVTGGDGLFTEAFDPTRTALRGYGTIFRLSKGGGSWLWDVNAADVSPGYEVNDLGFLREADYRWLNGSFGRRYTVPTRWYREFRLMSGAQQYWNHEGDVTRRDASLFMRWQLPTYWEVFAGGMRGFSALNDRKTRGGPVVGQPGSRYLTASIESDSRRAIGMELEASHQRADDGASDLSLGLDLGWKVAPNVKLSVGPSYTRSRATDQYVRAVDDPTATAFGGRRYVFSHLDQREVAMRTRASVVFTPGLSLELFAQPLIASGGYHDFQEYAAPRSQRRLVYGRDVGTVSASGEGAELEYTIDPDGPAGPAGAFTLGNPDFNFRSLRGTGVLRWEWRPGSTAYLVWTQTRSGEEAVGNLDLRRDQRALFREPADNIFVVKISYWIGG